MFLIPHKVTGGTYTTGRGSFHNSVAKHDCRGCGSRDEPNKGSGHVHNSCVGESSYGQVTQYLVGCQQDPMDYVC